VETVESDVSALKDAVDEKLEVSHHRHPPPPPPSGLPDFRGGSLNKG
jgi:hypothetical protein